MGVDGEVQGGQAGRWSRPPLATCCLHVQRSSKMCSLVRGSCSCPSHPAPDFSRGGAHPHRAVLQAHDLHQLAIILNYVAHPHLWE